MNSTATTAISPAAGIRFPVASRPQRRFSNAQTVSNATASSMQPIPLPATGFVRRVSLFFDVKVTGTTLARANGDAPFNLISGISLTDATGQSIIQTVSGYNLYLINKYLPGSLKTSPWTDPLVGPEVKVDASATAANFVFRLDLDLEQDIDTGYGCIPNLDANASLQVRIDLAPVSVALTGTVTTSTASVRVEQHYWAPVAATTGGVPNATVPAGFGDYVETRYENQTVSGDAENTVAVTNRGGLIRGIVVVSRANGVRTDFKAGSNVGLLYDNNAIDEGVTLESVNDSVRRATGYVGQPNGLTMAPYGNNFPGLDRGVLVYDFEHQGGGRDTWLSTRVGTLLQLKATPGANATQLEIITQIAQVKDAAAFYARD